MVKNWVNFGDKELSEVSLHVILFPRDAMEEKLYDCITEVYFIYTI